MTTKAWVGMSRHHNPSVAGREAAEQALDKAGVSKPDFVFVFGSVGYDQRSLVQAVRETTGGAPLTGCSAEGTINGDDADESNFSVVVTVISSDKLRWHNGLAAGLEAEPRAVGKRVAQDLLPHLSTDTIGLFVFPDGVKDFVVPTENLVDNFFAGLEENLPNERFLPMWGGGAGNNFNNWASPPYQYCDDEVITDGVSYALLSGKARAGWAISHGCIPIGGERIVTRGQGNLIYEIDGKPAMEVFEEYIPEGALTDDRDWFPYAISLSLCFKAPSYMKDEEYVVRGMPVVSMADGSITVQTEVPEGTRVWLSSRDKEKITTGFDRMAAQIKNQLGGEKPKLVFQFECGTRGKMMFREQEKLQLLKRFRQSLDPDAPWVGFYTVGEIGPVEEHNDRHLYTSVVLALVFMFGVGYSLLGLVQEGIAAPMGPFTPAAEWSGFSHSYTTGSPAQENEASRGQKTKEQTRKPPGAATTCDDVHVLVDRSHSLPSDYVPTDLVSLQDYRVPTLGSEVLRREAAEHLGHLVEGATKVGEELVVASAYRSYEEQQLSHDRLMSVFGVGADSMSATPGHSQHQLGTAVDFTNGAAGYQVWAPFAQTSAYWWLEHHAWEYGFVLAYPRGKEEQTGYQWEPWHYRYVGVEDAKRLDKSNSSLQGFLERARTMPHC